MKMGETRVSLRLVGPKGDAEIEMLVDTGSTLTKIPKSVATKIGIAARYKAEVELADGRVVERDESEAIVEFNGMKRTIPLLLGGEGEEPLLGLTTLEIFRLKVNPVTQNLEPAKLIDTLFPEDKRGRVADLNEELVSELISKGVEKIASKKNLTSEDLIVLILYERVSANFKRPTSRPISR